VQLFLGTSDDARLFFSSVQTNDSVLFGLDDVSRSLIVTEKSDTAINFALAAQTNPTIFVMSSNGGVDPTEHLAIAHNQTHGVLTAGLGSVAFSDEYVAASTWTDSYIPMFNSIAEWSAAYTLLGSATGSVWALINAGGGVSGLTTDQVLFGSSGGTIEQSASLTFNDNTQLKVGTGSFSYLGTQAGSVGVTGRLEVLNDAYFEDLVWHYAGAYWSDDIRAAFGDNGDGCLLFSTLQGYDCLVLGIDDYSRSFIMCDKTDVTNNWGFTQKTEPTVMIMPASTAGGSANRLELNHNSILGNNITIDSDAILTLLGTTHISFSDSSLRDILNQSSDTLTVNTLSSGVASPNFATGTNIQRVTIDANCTSVSMTAPNGPAELYLLFENNGTAHTITNFTSTTWYGNYDVDTTPYEIPISENVFVHLIYDGTAFHAWLIGEV